MIRLTKAAFFATSLETQLSRNKEDF